MSPKDPLAQFYNSDSPPSDWGDGGFSNPGVFDSLEEAVAAASTVEDDYLDELDTENDDVA